ncbi:MAG TPA: zinc-binding dehydrogenase [Chloroflexia bacterium]|nr:zinc-binding dehydrogenase [Chloroflexia bacterium]
MLPSTYHKLMVSEPDPNFKKAIQVVEVPLTEPGPGELLVKNRYAGMNASVGLFTAGLYPDTPPPPFEVQTEATGEVVMVGQGVTGFKPGDYVMTLGGGFGEYQTVNYRYAFPVPQATPDITSFMVSALTASISLEVVGEMKSNEVVLVTAAAGGTGQFAVQLAKLAGNHVIGTCSSEEKTQFLKELGCDRVINYKTEDLRQVLKTEYPKGVNLVYESVGGKTFDTCVSNLARFGRLIIIGYVSEYGSGLESVTGPRIYARLLNKSASIRGFFLPFYAKYYATHLARLLELYSSGKLKVRVDTTEFKGLAEAGAAYDFLHSGKSAGKVLITYE